MDITFNVGDFIADMNRAKDELLRRLQKGVNLACLDVEAAAKENCPKDTGNLMQSIMAEPAQIEGETVSGTVGTNLEYAVYVHEGTGQFSRTGMGRSGSWRYQDNEGNWHTTSGQAPQPFLENAYLSESGKVKQIVQAALNGG